MPRIIYSPKNRFVLKSKLDESQFVTLLHLFLQGLSAKDARRQFESYLRADGTTAPSQKTIANLFRRLGRYTFHKVVEPQFWMADHATCQSHLSNGRAAYQMFLDETSQNLIDDAKIGLSLEMFHTLANSKNVGSESDVLKLEIRALLVARKGTTDARSVVGLATYRTQVPGGLPRNRVDDEHLNMMVSGLLQDLVYDPLDEDGNTHSYTRIKPYRLPFANFGYPSWEKMHENKFSMRAWSKRRAQRNRTKQIKKN
ncbi:MAG: hypothetical protein AAF718_03580 [Pseudomonadota bacterium]